MNTFNRPVRRSLGAALASIGTVFLLVAGMLVMFEAPQATAAPGDTEVICHWSTGAGFVPGISPAVLPLDVHLGHRSPTLPSDMILGFEYPFASGTRVALAADLAICGDASIPEPVDPLLTVTKIANGGPNDGNPGAFSLFVDATPVTSGAQNSYSAGTVTVSETAVTDYTAVFTGNCASDGTILMALDGVYTCTITNTYIPPDQGSITLVKEFANNDLGPTSAQTDFTPEIDSSSVSWDTPVGLDPGTYSIGESGGPAGYTASDDCGGSVTLAAGEDVTCTITNTFDPPTLTVTKTVIGGFASAADFNLQVNLVGGSSTAAVLSIPTDYAPGLYTVSETQQTGYQRTGGWVGNCAGDSNATSGQFEMVGGQTYTCTITNIDPVPRLRVIKSVVGTLDNPNSFNLTVTPGGIVQDSAWNAYSAGDYVVSEDNNADWDEGPWGTDCAADGTVTLAPVTVQSAAGSWLYTCTITNTFVPPTTPTTVPATATTVVRSTGGATTTTGGATTTTGGATTTTTLVLGAQLPNTGGGAALFAFLLGGFGLTMQGAGLILLAPRRRNRWVL